MALDRPVKPTWGLKSIAFADLGKVDTATWEVITLVKQGTFTLTDTPPTLTPIYAEEVDEPLTNKMVKSGTRQIQVNAPEVSADIAEFLGGTVTTIGSGATQKKMFSFPGGVMSKMVRLEPIEGDAKYIYITNGQITHNLAGSLTKAGEDTLDTQLTIAINKGLGGTSYESEGLLFEQPDPEPVP